MKTAGLGEQARRAVETLLAASAVAADAVSTDDLRILYQAAVRVVLRVVVVLFAESRNLLPAGNAVYKESYSLHGLHEILVRTRVPDRRFAWSRICALFRLIHQGSPHPSLPVPAYGGDLFRAAPGETSDTLLKCLSLLEDPLSGPDDVAVGRILDLLTRVSAPGGERGSSRAATRERPYPQTSSELVGSLYQGLLDFRLVPDPWRLERNRSCRKESGSFYTPSRLSLATARHTLLPLCRGEDGQPRKPEEILRLKVCDPAMGSGTFLAGALAVLSQEISASLHRLGRLKPGSGGTVSTVVDLGKGAPFELPHAPGNPVFEALLEAHIKRQVVEECLYGVDSDPLAVELARISIWLETMDRHLPFTFLDHKLKCGNSLVGARLGDLDVYPIQAWRRAASDPVSADALGKLHARSVRQQELICGELASPSLPLPGDEHPRMAVHRLARVFREIHAVPSQFPERKRDLYERGFLASRSVQSARTALDTWCALWFWPDGSLDGAPLPTDLPAIAAGAVQTDAVAAAARDIGFFHWELEFPDVFDGQRPGFDALLGNPPWDVLKAAGDSLSTGASQRRRCLSNWFAGASKPGGRFDSTLRCRGRDPGRTRHQQRPFVLQGGSELNSYKLFLEQAMALCRKQGRLGLILPSGIYSDKGTGRLRRSLLSDWGWEWLFGFENRRRIFPVDSRVKFAVLVAQKRVHTGPPKTAFMRQDVADWEDPGPHAFAYPAGLLDRGSKECPPFMELTNGHDLGVLDKLQGSTGMNRRGRGWDMSCTREMDAGDPGKRFRSQAEMIEAGLKPTSFGWWAVPSSALVPAALPVLQGVMVRQLEFAGRQWRQQNGCGAWVCSPDETSEILPRFLLPISDLAAVARPPLPYKIGVRRIARNTDTRTVVASLIPNLPCTDKLSIVSTPSSEKTLALVAVLNSFCVDHAARCLCAGTNLDRHHLLRLPLPARAATPVAQLALIALRLNALHPMFAPLWLSAARTYPVLLDSPWRSWWVLDASLRTRLRALADALVARAFGLQHSDLAHILRDCNHSCSALADNEFARALDPRGFWRVDRLLPPEQRQTNMTLQLLADLNDGKDLFSAIALTPAPGTTPQQRQDWDDCREVAAIVSATEALNPTASRRLL